jgi:alpha-glucosidase
MEGRLVLAAALAAAAPLPAAQGAGPGASAEQVTVEGPAGARLRIEAREPHIVRIWMKPAGDFTRQPSLATEAAADTHSTLTRAERGDQVDVTTGPLEVTVSRATLAFEVRGSGGGPALLADARIGAQPGGAWTLTETLAAGEHLFGLGQDNRDNGRLDRRGIVRELWAGQQISSGNVTADYPVPLLLSTGRDGHAYGVFFDNVHRLRFDLGRARADRLRVEADGGEIDLYVLDGPRLADVIERYTGLTGRPSLPPLWALGYWQSKCTYYDWDALDEAYNQLTARGFPVDVMVIDADWPGW